jgi:hypothetical protein
MGMIKGFSRGMDYGEELPSEPYLLNSTSDSANLWCGTPIHQRRRKK